MKKIVLTGGGTAGHVTPNIALFPGLGAAGFEISYIGLRGGMEEGLIRPLGIPFYGITGGKLRRYADIKNITDIFKIGTGFLESIRILRKIRPDVLFSKGGFVSTPVVWAAYVCGVPVIVHESDMSVGLANKLSIPFAKKVCYAFESTGAQLPRGKGVYTGLPIRSGLLHGSREKGLEICGFDRSKPVLLAMGGSQGAQFINEMLRACLPTLLKRYQVCHICGKGNLSGKYKGVHGYAQFEYVKETQPHLYAAADVFVTRGGATSLLEVLELKKPAVIIPYSKKASRGDQILNGEYFVKQGFSEMLMESDKSGKPLSREKFMETIGAVYADRQRYITRMGTCRARNGAENVCKVICGLVKE